MKLVTPLPLVLALTLAASPAGGAAAPVAPATEGAAAENPIRGVKLGDFLIRDYSPVEGTKVRIRFTLYAAVKQKHASAFQKLMQEREIRVRDHIITAVRLVPEMAFDEPDLNIFRRRILLRLRRAMPELQIDEIYLTDFTFLSERT